MFNFHPSGNNKQKDIVNESNVIGHDRFCQIKPSSSRRSLSRNKKIFTKRSKSVAEFSHNTLHLARSKSIIEESNDLPSSSTTSTTTTTTTLDFPFQSFANILLRKRQILSLTCLNFIAIISFK